MNISELPNRVLLATDGSEDAAVATLAAIDIANKGGSELHVVHVWHDVPSPYAHFFIKRELERQGREVLDEQVSRIEGVGVEVAGVHLREGRITSRSWCCGTEPSGHRPGSLSATTTPRMPKRPQAWPGA